MKFQLDIDTSILDSSHMSTSMVGGFSSHSSQDKACNINNIEINTCSIGHSILAPLSLSLSNLIVQLDSFIVVSPGLHLDSFFSEVLCPYPPTEDSQQYIVLLD